MEYSEWHRRWEEDRIGFHQGEVNRHLRANWARLGLWGTERVLVPLCGAAVDLRWLAGRGHAVLGVEISARALDRLFEEARMVPTRSQRGPFEVSAFGSLEIWRGDFFQLQPELAPGLRAFYDRASLVAVDPARRDEYVQKLVSVLSPQARGLLVSLEYEEGSLKGPPFSVDEKEIRRLFEPHFEVEVAQRDPETDAAPAAARAPVETSYALTRRPAP